MRFVPLCWIGLLVVGCGDDADPMGTPDASMPDAGVEEIGPPSGPPPSYPFVGPEPGAARARMDDSGFTLDNAVVSARFEREGESYVYRSVRNRLDDSELTLGSALFEVILEGGTTISSSAMRVVDGPRVEPLVGDVAATRQAERYDGAMVVLTLTDDGSGLSAEVRAVLRDRASYVRTEVELVATTSDIPLRTLVLMDGSEIVGAPETSGSVPGSVIVHGSFFAGYEHPMATNRAGRAWRIVGTWDDTTVSYPAHTELSFDITDALSVAGPTEVTFQYTGGGYRLEVNGVSILENGVVVGQDPHFGATGATDVDNTWVIDLPSYDAAATYTLVAETQADGGLDSFGDVLVANGPNHRIELSFARNADLTVGDPYVQSSVVGVVPPGQLRRGFLYYLEMERSHPYRPFLHYNSWYDIGYFSLYDEAAALDVVRAYGEELVRNRGVTMDSLLLDDGWDDHATLWAFHDGFPNGFTAVQAATAEYGFSPGVWLSPFGGYGDPREQRLIAGEAAGYETNESGFVLSGPRYYERFRQICLEMIERYGVNQFKFDGVGRSSTPWPGSPWGSDFEAAITLISELRGASPDLYVNLTSGTWPSPFWLRHADSIWRGGYDHELTGTGSARQRWMTYRDAMVYERVVSRSPLYPLSALMLHGVIYAQQARDLDTDPNDDLQSEIRSFFGTGTQVQELYVTPALLTEANWDDIAESAKWARDRAAILQDTHWIGADPNTLAPYGWASMVGDRGVVVLRNPSFAEVTYPLRIDEAFELPEGAPTRWTLTSAYADQSLDTLVVEAGVTTEVALGSFEVLVLDAQAQ